MRYLSFKILVLCILLPPILYISAAYSLERHFQTRFTSDIEDVYIGDPEPLFDGSLRLQDAVNKNVDRYLRSKALISLGLKTRFTITTKEGKLIYPAVFNQDDVTAERPAPQQVAAENFGFMDEGFVITVETKFEHNRPLSNGILFFCILLSFLILYTHFRFAAKKAKIEDLQKHQEIDRLQKMEAENTKRMDALQAERGNLNTQIEKLRSVLEDQKRKADRDENDLIDEIEALEGKLSENLSLQNDRLKEIEQLRDVIQGYEKGQQKVDRQKIKASYTVQKRFNTLYKNITIHDRAISGFVELNEELKIKAEEVIHKLNGDPSTVTIKRKVFGRKGHQTVLEVIFAYKGRLYFRNDKDRRVEVLAVGTKNTQARELEFLAKL
jgi:cell division protein FtsB